MQKGKNGVETMANHSEMILGWFLVIRKPLWNDSRGNLND